MHDYDDGEARAYASCPMTGEDILADIHLRNAQRQPIALGKVHDFAAPSPYADFDTALNTVIAKAAADDFARRRLIAALERAGLTTKTKSRTAPLSPDFRVMEVAIFDNWPSGTQRKGSPHRYALSIKAWMTDDVDFHADTPDFKGNVTLMNSEALLAKAETVRNPKRCLTPLSAEYVAMIEGDVAPWMIETNFLGGMIFSKPHGEGTVFHDRQMVVIDPTALEVRSASMAMILRLGDKLIPIADWSTTDAGGKDFEPIVDKTGTMKARVVMQARHALSRRMSGLATNLPRA